MKAKDITTWAALAAALAFFVSRANAAARSLPVGPFLPYDDDTNNSWGEDIVGAIDRNDDAHVLTDKRIQAFLHMIRTLEHHPADPPYWTFYGRGRFNDHRDHPVLTGELRGVPLPPEMCRNAGYASGICVSTAAGAYQFTVPTWNDVRGILPRLPDFSPDSQDRAAARLLRKIGALDALLRDDFDSALRAASKRWASLPYSTAQQDPKSYQYALSEYLEYLGA